uniref:Uncharacterized protein n=1 Tax=Aegilops tauschii subsp. strangulata TaxID=200361 RepID=A0A452ZJC2_AEGTS
VHHTSEPPSNFPSRELPPTELAQTNGSHIRRLRPAPAPRDAAPASLRALPPPLRRAAPRPPQAAPRRLGLLRRRNQQRLLLVVVPVLLQLHRLPLPARPLPQPPHHPHRGGEGQRMAVRAGAGAGLQQRLHQHAHDRRQAPLRRAVGARPHRPHQGMHPADQGAGRAGGAHRAADLRVRAQGLPRALLQEVPQGAGVGGAAPVELARQPAARVLRGLPLQAPRGRGRRHALGRRDRAEGIGPYVEVAFYHKPSRTLLVTDAVIFVPRQPPDCISKESLLAAAKNGLAVKILSKGREVPDDPVEDNKLTRQTGWERMVLQILFLGPSNLLEPNASFAQMSQKLIVSPIVKTLVFSKVPEKVRDWVDRIAADWPFRRIIPAHFAAPINASRSDFLAAFAFLDEFLPDRPAGSPGLSLIFASLMGKAASYFPPDDMKTLSSLDDFLVSVGAVKKTVSGRKR